MGAIATQPLWLRIAVFRVGQNIRDLNGPALKQDPPGKTPSPRRKCKGFMMFNVFGREAVSRRDVVPRLRRAEDLSHIRLAKTRRRLDERVKHRLQIKC